MLSVGALSPCLCTFWAYVVWIAIGDKLNQHFSFLYFTVLFYLIRITKNFIFILLPQNFTIQWNIYSRKEKSIRSTVIIKQSDVTKKFHPACTVTGSVPPITVTKSAPFCCARVIAICRFRDGLTYSKRSRRTVSFWTRQKVYYFKSQKFLKKKINWK